MKKKFTTEERFWTKVNKADSCWNWLAYTTDGGYGQIRLNRKNIYTHRFSWELHNGPIPDKLCVCHKCDNRKCVNPDHLFLGTHMDNAKDRDNKNRANHPKGEDIGGVKLTEKEVLEIRFLYLLGNISQIKLAKEYKISQQQISDIVNRKRWKHI